MFKKVFLFFLFISTVFVVNGAITKPFVSVKHNSEKVSITISNEIFSRRLLISTTVSQTSDYHLAGVGFRTHGIYGRLELIDNSVILRRINSDMAIDDVDSDLKTRIEESHFDGIVARFPILRNMGNTFEVDASDFFLESKECSIFDMNFSRATGKIDRSLSYIVNANAFEKNIFVSTVVTYDVTDKEGKSHKLTTQLGHTILLLPESRMRPRLSDERIGFFTTKKQRVNFQESDKYQMVEYLERFRVEPSDWEAYRRGELVKPINPIVFYVDDKFPKDWIEPICKGVMVWNEAFREIGFKDVIEARIYPSKMEDPEFTPDNLSYNCIRWIPTDRGGAMGPSWNDPVTGEVICANIYVWGSLLESQNAFCYVQTAQANPKIRSGHMTGKLLSDALQLILCHEVGHTLGLAHNMGASAAYSIDSLRSASFIERNGLSPSVMDYIYYNYIVSHDEEGKVPLWSPRLGIYDKLAIKYIYTPNDRHSSLQQDAHICAKYIDEVAGNPAYRYVVQQWGNPQDPTAVIDDISNDVITASQLSFNNLQYVLEHTAEWLSGNNPSRKEYRKFIYDELVKRYITMLSYVAYVVGGVRKGFSNPGTAGFNYQVLPVDYQHKAILVFATELRRSRWVDCPQLRSQFQASERPSHVVIRQSVATLLKRLSNIEFANGLVDEGSTYTIEDFCNDIAEQFFGKVQNPTATDLYIQREIKAQLKLIQNNQNYSSSVKSAVSSLLAEL